MESKIWGPVGLGCVVVGMVLSLVFPTEHWGLYSEFCGLGILARYFADAWK